LVIWFFNLILLYIHKGQEMARIDDIESLMYDAYAYGIQDDVRDIARNIISENRFIDPLVAYETAFQQTMSKNETGNDQNVHGSNA